MARYCELCDRWFLARRHRDCPACGAPTVQLDTMYSEAHGKEEARVFTGLHAADGSAGEPLHRSRAAHLEGGGDEKGDGSRHQLTGIDSRLAARLGAGRRPRTL